jgi:hypothetical protein
MKVPFEVVTEVINEQKDRMRKNPCSLTQGCLDAYPSVEDVVAGFETIEEGERLYIKRGEYTYSFEVK